MQNSEDDQFVESTNAFLSWLRQSGASISSKVNLADLRSQSAGRGVVATHDIADDEELFGIPRSSILTVETSNIPDAASAGLADPWLSLILTMIFEHQQGLKSTWAPYFHVLPQSFDTLMFWSADELELLEGSAVLGKIGKTSADAAFTSQLLPVIRQNSHSFQANVLSDADILALCHRMGSTIMAYAFDLEKTAADRSRNEEDGWEEASDDGEVLQKGMVPLADMLNADADRNNAKLFYEDDKVIMRTVKPVKAGEELFNDYGPLPRADVLRRYGYITDNYAKYDVLEISTELIKDRVSVHRKLLGKELDGRLAYADEQGILDTAYDISRPGSEEGQFPDELCILLNLLCTSKDDFDKLQKKDKLPKPELMKEARTLLYIILVYRMALYPSSTDTEMQGIENTNETRNDRRRNMARHIIQGEKEVLQEAANATAEASNSISKKRPAETVEDEASHIRQPAKK